MSDTHRILMSREVPNSALLGLQSLAEASTKPLHAHTTNGGSKRRLSGNGNAKILSGTKRLKTSNSSTKSSKDKPTKVRLQKGLRHFSVKVCEKLSQSVHTTYNEIANLLVKDFFQEHKNNHGDFDEKNIRRRIYDALNVLMAMDIIEKDKKEIRWRGIKFAPQVDSKQVEAEKAEMESRIRKKKHLLEEMTIQYIALKNLVDRNSKPQAEKHKDKLYLPFVVVNTNKLTDITCEMTDDRSQVFFQYSNPFQIHDENLVVKSLSNISTPHGDIASLVPSELQPFLPISFPSSSSFSSSSSSSSSSDTTMTSSSPTNTNDDSASSATSCTTDASK